MLETEEYFDIVDEEGKPLYKEKRTNCHNGSKLLHPVVHIHVINSSNKLLLQKRALNKKIQPGKWDTSVGGHIISGEIVEDALVREAKEELGIDVDINKILFLKKYIFESSIEREFVYSYIYFYDGEINFLKSEIDEVAFFSKDEIEKLIKSGNTTENFIVEYNILNEKFYN